MDHFCYFPDFSVAETAVETLIAQRPTKSVAMFVPNLANCDIMLGLEKSSLDSVLWCYSRVPSTSLDAQLLSNKLQGWGEGKNMQPLLSER